MLKTTKNGPLQELLADAVAAFGLADGAGVQFCTRAAKTPTQTGHAVVKNLQMSSSGRLTTYLKCW